MTTSTIQTEPNPFALMMEPEAIFAAMAASERLARLKSRICRPLDKPLLGKTDGDEAEGEGGDDADDFGQDGTQPEAF